MILKIGIFKMCNTIQDFYEYLCNTYKDAAKRKMLVFRFPYETKLSEESVITVSMLRFRDNTIYIHFYDNGENFFSIRDDSLFDIFDYFIKQFDVLELKFKIKRYEL